MPFHLAEDDLKQGMFITVVGCKLDDEDLGMFPAGKPSYDGKPLQILGISLPFVAVNDGRRLFSIDMRRWLVTALDPKYVAVYAFHFDQANQQNNPALQAGRRRRKKKKQQDDRHENDCPRCGARMIQRMIADPDVAKMHWRKICPVCDLDQGPMIGASLTPPDPKGGKT